jgi:hypothetical protein
MMQEPHIVRKISFLCFAVNDFLVEPGIKVASDI